MVGEGTILSVLFHLYKEARVYQRTSTPHPYSLYFRIIYIYDVDLRFSFVSARDLLKVQIGDNRVDSFAFYTHAVQKDPLYYLPTSSNSFFNGTESPTSTTRVLL